MQKKDFQLGEEPKEIKRRKKYIREHNNNKQKTVVYQSKDILKEGWRGKLGSDAPGENSWRKPREEN
jgi:hypothetical protein